MVYEVHKVVELRSDDDFGAAVALLAYFGVVVGDGVELASARCRETLRIDAELCLEHLHDRGCTECGEVPVVADVGLRSTGKNKCPKSPKAGSLTTSTTVDCAVNSSVCG